MASRLDLQSFLENLIQSPNVYFQPPSSKDMEYPAIRYSLKDIENRFANNKVYRQLVTYELIVIDEDPDSEIVKHISQLPKCKFDRHFTADNLNHTVFTLYF
jgi:hypothetical protein